MLRHSHLQSSGDRGRMSAVQRPLEPTWFKQGSYFRLGLEPGSLEAKSWISSAATQKLHEESRCWRRPSRPPRAAAHPLIRLVGKPPRGETQLCSRTPPAQKILIPERKPFISVKLRSLVFPLKLSFHLLPTIWSHRECIHGLF